MRRGPAVLLLLILLAAAAYGAQRAMAEGWKRLTGFAPIYLKAPRPSTGSPQLAGRLVLVIVPGLRTDDAPFLPTLDWLRRQGAGLTLSVPAPGYPVPAAATLLSGALPRNHGVLPGPVRRALPVDSLPAAVQRVKLTTGGVGDADLGALVGSAAGTWLDADTPAKIVEAARALLAPSGPRLIILGLDGFHLQTHKLGSADRSQPEYRDALADLDALLVDALAPVDLKTTAVVVVGTAATGADGRHRLEQPVPLIMAGAGIRKDYRGAASLVDVASTAAALLGAPAPLQSSGRPLVEALQVDGRQADVLMQRNLAVRKAFTDATLQSLGVAEPVADPPGTAAEAPAYVGALEQRVQEAQFALWKALLMQRLPYLGGALLVLLLYLFAAFRQPFGGPLLMGILTYQVVFHGLFFLWGGRYSAAMVGLEHMERTLPAGLGLRTAIGMTVAVVVTGFFLSRRNFKHGPYLSAATLHMVLSTCAVVALPVVGALVFVGWDFPVALPAPGLLVWYFVAALQVVVIGYMGLIWAMIAVWSARFSRRVWPRKEVGDPEVNADKVVRARALRRSVRTQRPPGPQAGRRGRSHRKGEIGGALTDDP